MHRLLDAYIQEASGQPEDEQPRNVRCAGQGFPLSDSHLAGHQAAGARAQVRGLHVRAGARSSQQSRH